MSKFFKIAVLAFAATLTVSFGLADTPADSTSSAGSTSSPQASSGQATPTVKSAGKTKPKAAGKKVNKAKAKAEKQIAAKDSYICPMCKITADKPGKCPMCGMDMVKNEKNEKKAADEKKM